MATGESSQVQNPPKRKFELLDPDVLRCPLCFEDLSPPVLQCPTGHAMCGVCFKKISHSRCPTCRATVGYRSISLEKILESLLVNCRNCAYGCPEMLKYANKTQHESTLCKYQPFDCVFQGCQFRGSTHSLPLHFQEEHRVQTLRQMNRWTMTPTDEYSFLQEPDDDRLYVVRRETQRSLGDKFACACFGAFVGLLRLAITVEDGPPGLRHTFTLETQGCDIREGDQWKQKFLVVPDGVHGVGNREFRVRLEVEVSTNKARKVPEVLTIISDDSEGSQRASPPCARRRCSCRHVRG